MKENSCFILQKQNKNEQFVGEVKKEKSYWSPSHITETNLEDPMVKQPPIHRKKSIKNHDH